MIRMKHPGIALLINSSHPQKVLRGILLLPFSHPQIFRVVTNSICPRRMRHNYFKRLLGREAELVGNAYTYISVAWIPPAGGLRHSACPVADSGSQSSQLLAPRHSNPQGCRPYSSGGTDPHGPLAHAVCSATGPGSSLLPGASPLQTPAHAQVVSVNPQPQLSLQQLAGTSLVPLVLHLLQLLHHRQTGAPRSVSCSNCWP